MLKQAPQLQAITAGAQHDLAQSVEKSFEFFVESRRLAIHPTFPMFLSTREKGESAVGALISLFLTIPQCHSHTFQLRY